MSRPNPNITPVTAGPGYYAVADPTDGRVMTYWHVDRDGAMHRYPPGARYEPMPPESLLDFADRDTRRLARQEWYADVYFPWKSAVVEEINADPVAARAAFALRYPEALAIEAERAARRRQRATWVRYEQVHAALAADRLSIAGLARGLGRAWATTRARIAAGRALIAADPAAARGVLLERYVAEAAALQRRIDKASDPTLAERLARAADQLEAERDEALARLEAMSATSAAPQNGTPRHALSAQDGRTAVAGTSGQPRSVGGACRRPQESNSEGGA